MATEHGSWQIALVGGMGFLISGQPSRSWEENVKGVQVVYLLPRMPLGVGKVDKEGAKDTQLSYFTTVQSTA